MKIEEYTRMSSSWELRKARVPLTTMLKKNSWHSIVVRLLDLDRGDPGWNLHSAMDDCLGQSQATHKIAVRITSKVEGGGMLSATLGTPLGMKQMPL